MSNWTLTRRGDNRSWPNYLFRGRVRTSTASLVVVFIALFWVNQQYQVPAQQEPAQQVVPPGYVPDPAYTWVPRTNVNTRDQDTTTRTTTTTPSTTTTSETTGTTTPSSTSPTSPTSTPPGLPGLPGLPGSTTVIDPDGSGPQSPETFTQAPTLAPTSVPAPVPFPGLGSQPR